MEANTPSALARALPSLKTDSKRATAAGAVKGRGDAFDQTRGDQGRRADYKSAGNAGKGKNRKRQQEHAAVAEVIGDAAAEQQEAAVAEYIGADCPLQRGRRHPEFFLDCRQGHPNGGDVHGVKEVRGAQQRQR